MSKKKQKYRGFTFISEKEEKKFNLRLDSKPSEWNYEYWSENAYDEDEAILLLKESINEYWELELEKAFIVLTDYGFEYDNEGQRLFFHFERSLTDNGGETITNVRATELEHNLMSCGCSGGLFFDQFGNYDTEYLRFKVNDVQKFCETASKKNWKSILKPISEDNEEL